jgi:molybdenum cofactor cytidylyltransferase
MTTCGVLLAAGSGSRFHGDSHKLIALLEDKLLVQHALESVLAAGFDEVIVVDGAIDLALAIGERRVTVVHNAAWATGIASSLRAALTQAEHEGHDAIVVGLGDQPGVTTDAWRAVAASDATPVAVATYDGRRGNPVRLAAEVWPLLPEDGDEGARALMRDRPELVTEVPCSGSAFDIDTTEDLRQLGGNP